MILEFFSRVFIKCAVLAVAVVWAVARGFISKPAGGRYAEHLKPVRTGRVAAFMDVLKFLVAIGGVTDDNESIEVLGDVRRGRGFEKCLGVHVLR